MADARCEDAVEFMRKAEDAESDNRQNALTALRFRYGDQWPAYATSSRGIDRPQLTINETNTYIKKICNMQRKQRPRGKASPVGDGADKKIAKVITGIGRHIEVNSDGDNAYDTAFDFAATMGWGYWRLRTDYISENSFNQDIFLDVVDNPFTVYGDPAGSLPDGSDWESALITDMMRKKEYRKKYPGAQVSGVEERGTGDSPVDWTTDGEEGDIRLAEYFHIARKPAKLVQLSDGMALYEDELPPMAVMMGAGIEIVGFRESFKRVVKWRKQSAFDILEEKDLPGRWIPIVPVYWTRVVIDGKRICHGLVKDAIDPARMNNFWQTAITESLALAPKAKWLIAEGQDEGHETEFKNANLSNVAVLRYKPTDVSGSPAPPPQRIQPEPPPAGMIEAVFMASQNLSRVMGVFDPAVRGGAQHKSDRTLNAEQGQSENTNFDGYDNLVRSIKHSWRIMLSWVPSVFDTERVQRIIGDDGKEELVTLNERAPSPDDQAIETVLNDVTVGTYDVVIETGPGYDTRRQEGVAATMELMNTPVGEKVAAVADDLIVRQMDFPGADAIADRLAAANPMASIDDKSDIPPQVQMMLKQAQATIQQQGAQIQGLETELKLKSGIEQMRQDGETKRALMRETAHAHDIESRNLSMQHSTEVKAVTAQNVEEIRSITDLLLAHIDTQRLEKEIAQRDREQQVKNEEAASAQLQ